MLKKSTFWGGKNTESNKP